ncbi:MAG: ribonuclease [Thiobacillaceae bacterium]|jgi:ribonuclease T1|nr:ribonuclease [Thiobacillaceae bacterium]
MIRLLLLIWLGLFSGFLPAAGQAFWSGDRSAEQAGIPVSQLPPEGRETLALIKRGGPFPYAKDGTVFQNREGLLPAQTRGYYREYTVRTPGLSHRGARRIVAGRGGEYWYTADHYRSFKRIRE